MPHTSVLLQETIHGLGIRPGDTAIDGTAGAGGHSRALCHAVGKKGILLAIDRDPQALARTREALADCPGNVEFAQGNFRELHTLAHARGIAAVDRILLDLGLSSMQIEESGRGFSFQRDEPLLMTMGPGEEGITARDIVNGWDENEIARILAEYGEERFARRIARAIAEARRKTPIETSGALAAIVASCLPPYARRGRIHPATRTFQALRMATNDELPALRDVLEHGIRLLRTGGRIAVISFHSIEDREVKHFFRENAATGVITIITKKPIIPSPREIAENRRARSAKLRIAEKI